LIGFIVFNALPIEIHFATPVIASGSITFRRWFRRCFTCWEYSRDAEKKLYFLHICI